MVITGPSSSTLAARSTAALNRHGATPPVRTQQRAAEGRSATGRAARPGAAVMFAVEAPRHADRPPPPRDISGLSSTVATARAARVALLQSQALGSNSCSKRREPRQHVPETATVEATPLCGDGCGWSRAQGVGEVTERDPRGSFRHPAAYLERLESAAGTDPVAAGGEESWPRCSVIATHSNWSDGGSPIGDMAVAATRLGWYMVLTDHSGRLTVAKGSERGTATASSTWLRRSTKRWHRSASWAWRSTSSRTVGWT